MIEELLKIADIQGLTGHEPERARPIHWLIDLDAEGRALQLSPTTAESKRSRDTMTEDRGKHFLVPEKYHLQMANGEVVRTNANQHTWFPDFLLFKGSELFPRGVDGKQSVREHKRRSTWSLLHEAASDELLHENVSLRAILKYLHSRPRFDEIHLAIDDPDTREVAIGRIADGSERLTFRVAGRLPLQDPQIRDWWQKRNDAIRQSVSLALPKGSDGYQSEVGPLPHFHPTISSGMLSGVSLFSYDKAPFKSFGLGQLTTRVTLVTSEKMAAALNWLMNDESSSLSFGEYKAVFWATTDDSAVPVDFAQLLDTGDPLAVRDFLVGPWSGSERELDTTKFHAALLRKSGKGRFAVNSWHTDTLGMGRQHVSMWFNALRVPTPQSRESAFVSIRELAECTVRKSKETRPLPATYQTLFEAALFGSPVPQKLLAAVLRRQSLELATGTDKKKQKEFDGRLTARTALIQAYFALKKGKLMSNDQKLEASAGYWCGRLLAILDRIHNEAHDNKTNSSPANRSYGAASTTPALIFPQLCKLVRVHLAKVKGKRDSHGNKAEQCLEFGYPQFNPPLEGLADVCAKLRTTGAEFPPTLSLEKQGHFAIGFYYERCLRWPAFNAGNQKANETSPESE